MSEKLSLLVVEDNPSFMESLLPFLERWGYAVSIANTGAQAREILETKLISLILLDLKLPDTHGFEILEFVKKFQYPPEVIVLTGQSDIETAVTAMKLGAFDYLPKPIDMDSLQVHLQKAAQITHLRGKLKEYEDDELSEIVGVSPAINQIKTTIKQLRDTDITILLLGESGVGKEIVAKAIHRLSHRNHGPFVVINCAAIPETLLESELFGHERGSFTGAVERHIGKFERANNGTIFLDEIGEMNLTTQVRILRILEDKSFERVGGKEMLNVETRIIAATNQPLNERVESGKFREDLYYRLAVYPINIPPLRERKEDIPLLFTHFLKLYATPASAPKVSAEVFRVLQSYSWPGNVREMRNIAQRLLITSGHNGVIQKQHLGFLTINGKSAIDIPQTLAKIEQSAIINALNRNEGNITHAAKELDIGRDTLYRKIKIYKIPVPKQA